MCDQATYPCYLLGSDLGIQSQIRLDSCSHFVPAVHVAFIIIIFQPSSSASSKSLRKPPVIIIPSDKALFKLRRGGLCRCERGGREERGKGEATQALPRQEQSCQSKQPTTPTLTLPLHCAALNKTTRQARLVPLHSVEQHYGAFFKAALLEAHILRRRGVH